MGKMEEIQIGEKAEIIHVITREDIERFVRLTGDDNRMHVDPEYAARTPFKQPVVHGMLGASFISTIIGTRIPGDGALWFAQSLEFLLPVRVGDTITVEAEVIKKQERQGYIELRTDIFNQHKQKVTTGTAKVKIIEQEGPEEETAPPVRSKTVLILGASGGIGAETARLLAREGWKVILHCHSNRQKAEALQHEIEKGGGHAMVVAADLSDKEAIREMFIDIRRFHPRIDGMVNATTIKFAYIKLDRLEWEDIQAHLEINIRSSFLLVQEVLPLMAEAKYGKMVFLTSQSTESTPPLELLHYVTAKSALNGFVKGLAVELAAKGVRVNLVSPGMTMTDLVADVSEKTKLLTAAKAPLKRLADPEDVAQAIAFLVSERSDYLTGETIRVNGGQVML